MKRPRQDSKILSLIRYIRVAALFMGAAILFFACENDIEKIKAFSSTEDLPVAEIIDFYTMSTDSGKLSYTLKAPKVIRYELDGEEYTEFPEGMEVKRFDKNGKIVSSIRADFAKQGVLEDKWEASNNVIATNIEGDTLKTEHLVWEREKGLIYNNEYVKIISADRIIWGEGFTSDEQMQGWKIKKPKGNIYITVDEPVESSDEVSVPEIHTTDTTKEIPFKRELQFDR